MPEIGDMAPDFSLPSTEGDINLSELTAGSKVLLAFYAEDNTPLCTSELSVFKEDFDLIEALSARVVAVSADNIVEHMDFAERLGGLPFPLASDPHLEVAKLYGVADEDAKRSRRAVFVIDRGGEILHSEPWFQPGNPTQYEAIFKALGFDA